MKTSKIIPTLSIVLLLNLANATFAFTDLTTFGTSDFAVDTGFSDAPFSQSATTLSLNTPFSSGQILAGDFASAFNWSSEPGFALVLSSIDAPNALLVVEFQNAAFVPLAVFNVGTGLMTATPTSFTLNPVSGSISALTQVAALEFKWNGSSLSGDTAVTVHALQSVPEPSTYALLTLVGVGLGGYVLRRRLRA
jgi:hypothetical protein